MDNDKYVSTEEWGQMHARAWRDQEFKDLLERDPAAAARKFGIEGKHIFRIDSPPGDLDETQISMLEKGYEKIHPRLSC
jgi:hypothetical protein